MLEQGYIRRFPWEYYVMRKMIQTFSVRELWNEKNGTRYELKRVHPIFKWYVLYFQFNSLQKGSSWQNYFKRWIVTCIPAFWNTN